MAKKSAPPTKEGCIGCLGLLVPLFALIGYSSEGGAAWIFWSLFAICLISILVFANERKKRKIEEKKIAEEYEKFKQENFIHIRYMDASGSFTERDVYPKNVQVLKNGRIKLFAFCDARKDERTFYVDSILECVEIKTGEVIDDVGAYLLERLNKKQS